MPSTLGQLSTLHPILLVVSGFVVDTSVIYGGLCRLLYLIASLCDLLEGLSLLELELDLDLLLFITWLYLAIW